MREPGFPRCIGKARRWPGLGFWCFASLLYSAGFAQNPAPVKLPTVDEEIHRAVVAAPLKLQFHGSTPAELEAWQRDFSAKLDGLVGPHTPPKVWKVKLLSTREFADHTREELLLESDAAPSLPLYVLRPKASAGARFPIVLCLHGHGEFGHDPVAGVDDTPALKEEIRKMNYDYGRQLVREGYLAVSRHLVAGSTPDRRGAIWMPAPSSLCASCTSVARCLVKTSGTRCGRSIMRQPVPMRSRTGSVAWA